MGAIVTRRTLWRVSDSSVRRFLPGRGNPVWVALLLFCLLPAGCTEDKNPVGFDQGSRGGFFAEPETVLVSEPAADAEIRPPRTTGSALSLLVGRDGEANAHGLVRFETLPDTTGIRFAWLRLHAKRGRGQGIYLEIRRILGDAESWDPNEVTWETAPEVSEDPLESSWPVRTGAIEDTVSHEEIPRFVIPMSLIRSWAEDPDSNAGLQISIAADESNFGIARIVSHNDLIYDVDGALIRTPALILADSSGTDIYEIEATQDAYVIEDLRPVPSGINLISNISAGTPARYVLRFDLDAIPVEASIVRAQLTLPLRDGQISDERPIRLAVYETMEAWEELTVPDSLETASLPVSVGDYGAAADTMGIEFEIAPLIQAWMEELDNYGITVRFADETASADGIEVFTREADRKPSLKIIYVLPLDFRWGETQ